MKSAKGSGSLSLNIFLKLDVYLIFIFNKNRLFNKDIYEVRMTNTNQPEFKKERDMQKHIQKHISFLSGIPDLNCDGNVLFPIGREIKVLSGKLDNLFIDKDGVLTIVECKLYSNNGIKRDVYSQILNYAADIKTMCYATDDDELIASFDSILEKTSTSSKRMINEIFLPNEEKGSFALIQEHIYKKISENSGKDEFGKNEFDPDELDKWGAQFKRAFCENIRKDAMRLIILCSPQNGDEMKAVHFKNLMNIMSFSENSNSPYELLLMNYESGISRIIWRRYVQLPELQITRERRVKYQEKIDEVKANKKALDKNPVFKAFFNWIDNTRGLSLDVNTHGYSIKKTDDGKVKSTYVGLKILSKKNYYLRIYQIREDEELYKKKNEFKELAREATYLKLVEKGHIFELQLYLSGVDGGKNFSEEVKKFIIDHHIFNRT